MTAPRQFPSRPTPLRRKDRIKNRPARILTTGVVALLAAVLAPATPASAAPAECVTDATGAVQVTPDCVDSLYANPVIDSEQDRTTPVAHHQVSGHFDGTNIKFNIYLPPADQWQGRFFQYTYPTAFTAEEDTSVASDRAIAFAVGHGAYTVQAGLSGVSLGYRHSAAAAKFAETYAAGYYHWNQKIYGYLHGPSGGSYQTTGAAENTTGVWDGFAPTVQGVPMTGPYTFLIRSFARLVLADKADQIADAVRPGGSGDPYAGLDAVQTAMLKELTSFGVPLQAWEDPDYLLSLSAPDAPVAFEGNIRQIDPSYVTDFWTKQGYLGTEQSPLGDFVRAALASRGDTVDNRWNIALRVYYRYQVPAATDGYVGWDQFRNADGTPKYPQRAFLIGPAIFRAVSGGAAYTGKITAKMIVIDNLYDVDALPIYADWYAKRVKTALGDSAYQANYRVYYNDHADHLEGPVTGAKASRIVSYDPMVEQALLDLSAWAEQGVTPPPSTQYKLTDGQITVPKSAAKRGGIQPVVDLKVFGRDRIDIKAGQWALFIGSAQAPPGTGKIVSVGWDFTGSGSYSPGQFGKPAFPVQLALHRFTTPGTYYVTLKVASSRTRASDAFAQVENLDRVRVVVH